MQAHSSAVLTPPQLTDSSFSAVPAVVPEGGASVWLQPDTGPSYDRFASAAWYGDVLDTMSGMLPLRGSDRVIDVGSGTGRGSRLIGSRLVDGGRVLGIDASPVQVDYAMSKLSEGSPISYRALSLNDAAASFTAEFDGAVFYNSIHLLGKLSDVLEATAGMLRPGAFIGFCSGYSSAANEPSSSTGISMVIGAMRELAQARFPEAFEAAAEETYGPRTLFPIRMKSLERDVSKAGFCDLAVEFRTYQLPMESVIEFLSLPGIGETILPDRIKLSDRQAIVSEVLRGTGLTHVPRVWCFATARRHS